MVARGGDHFAAPVLEAAEQGKPPATLGQRLKAVGRAVVTRGASSLTRRIVLLNLLGLVALLLGFLYLNQFREGLIDARVQSLSTQGEIIAGAIAASAMADTDTVTIDPDKLLQLQAGESYGLNDDTQSPLEFSINPEKVGPLVRRLVTPTRTRARVYDREGLLLIDSRFLYVRGDITRLDLPPLAAEEPTVIERTWNAIRGRFGRSSLPLVEDFGAADGKSLPEVTRALSGIPGSVVRVIASGETIVSVAVPIQRSKTVRGALLLSTQGGDIDQMIAKERFGILQVFLIAALVMVVLSVLLAGTIAEPIRRLREGIAAVLAAELGDVDDGLRRVRVGAARPRRRSARRTGRGCAPARRSSSRSSVPASRRRWSATSPRSRCSPTSPSAARRSGGACAPARCSPSSPQGLRAELDFRREADAMAEMAARLDGGRPVRVPDGAPRPVHPAGARAGALRGLHGVRRAPGSTSSASTGRRSADQLLRSTLDQVHAARLLPRRPAPGQRVRARRRHARADRLRRRRAPRPDPAGGGRRHARRARPPRRRASCATASSGSPTSPRRRRPTSSSGRWPG